MQQKFVGLFDVNDADDNLIYFLLFFFLVGSLFGLYVSMIAREAAKYVLNSEVTIDKSYLAFIICGIAQPLFICFLGASVFGCFILPLIVVFKGFILSLTTYFLFKSSFALFSTDLLAYTCLMFLSCMIFVFFCSKAFKSSLVLLKNLLFGRNSHNHRFLLDYFKCSGFVLICFIVIITLKYIIIFR